MLTGIPDVPVVTSPYLTVGEVVGGVILFHAAVPLIYPLEIIVARWPFGAQKQRRHFRGMQFTTGENATLTVVEERAPLQTNDRGRYEVIYFLSASAT